MVSARKSEGASRPAHARHGSSSANSGRAYHPLHAVARPRVLLAVARFHQIETEDGALEQLALYPVDRRAIYAGKALVGAIAMVILGILVIPAVALLYAVNIGPAWAVLVLTVVLGAIGFAAAGTFYAAVTVRMRAREVMLPLLVLPIIAPLLLAAVKATTAALAGDPLGELPAWLELLAGFDVVMLVAGAGTYGFLLEE